MVVDGVRVCHVRGEEEAERFDDTLRGRITKLLPVSVEVDSGLESSDLSEPSEHAQAYMRKSYVNIAVGRFCLGLPGTLERALVNHAAVHDVGCCGI